MDESRNYKKELFWMVIFTLVLMYFQLFVMELVPDGQFPGVWVGLLIVIIIRGFTIDRYKHKKDNFDLIVPIAMIVNYILFKNGTSIPNYIVLFFSIGIVCIFSLIKINSKYKFINIALICILFISFFSLDYYLYSNRLIKDVNFYRVVKKEYNISGKINKNSLKDIDRLWIGSKYDVTSLEGIHHFKNLKDLNIRKGKRIKDLKPINHLENLEHLNLSSIGLDQLEELNKMESLEWLEIIYPEKGKIKNLSNLPNLKKLALQGIKLNDLSGLKGPSDLEELSIAFSEVNSFDGIQSFKHLKKVKLHNVYIKDTESLLKFNNIESISIFNCKIDNKDEFVRNARNKGIDIEIENKDNFLLEL